ncbi:MAG TPA: LD-carboxypeptidase [Longimicrobiaceae bacterium]|nr:LD-carboxypeptidase [Longimicrobiaceae bacterium]
MIRPPALRPGARVSLVAPAGPLPEGAVDRAVERIRDWGWEPVLGGFCRGRCGYLSGTDEERAADLNAALRSPDNDAVWCLRGGYGTMRILDRIDWGALSRRPRPLIGFSDNTALHLAAQREGVVSFHGPHPATPELSGFSRAALLRVLTGGESAGLLPFPDGGPPRAETVVGGRAEGRLVGGNLALLAALAGTPYALRGQGAILFLEEVGEPSYRVDRMLSQLLLSGALEGVAGIAVGAFSETPDADREDLPPAVEVIADRLGGPGVPLASGFPFGHVEESWTLPLGVRARLDADAGTLELLESAVAAPESRAERRAG